MEKTMLLGKFNRGFKTKKEITKARQDVLTGVAKEMVLGGLYALKETTGADWHYKKKKGKHAWEKKWRER